MITAGVKTKLPQAELKQLFDQKAKLTIGIIQ